MKKTAFKIFQNLVIFELFAPTPPLEKIQFWDPEKSFVEKVPIDSSCPKMSPGILLRPPKGTGIKK